MLPNFRKVDVDTAKNNSSPALFHIATSNNTLGSSHRIPDKGVPSIIGQSLQITGNLISQGEVQVEGEITGDIHGSYVIIGETAQITGTIIADEVVVRGNVFGKVRGKRVHLQTTARVDGDIYHNSIAIEQGAYFEGKSRRVEDPTADLQDEIDQDLTSNHSNPRHSSFENKLQHCLSTPSLGDKLQQTLSRTPLYYGERTKLDDTTLEHEPA